MVSTSFSVSPSHSLTYTLSTSRRLPMPSSPSRAEWLTQMILTKGATDICREQLRVHDFMAFSRFLCALNFIIIFFSRIGRNSFFINHKNVSFRFPCAYNKSLQCSRGSVADFRSSKVRFWGKWYQKLDHKTTWKELETEKVFKTASQAHE